MKCVNNTGIQCKNDTEIKNAINRKNMHVFFEDFDLTPFDYEKPVKEKLTLNTCPIRMDEFQTFVGYFQLVNIETENNLFGFEAFSDIKSEKYIIYHSTLIMNYEMMPGQAEVSTYNILLKENTLNNLRTYTQFIDVLGDVGGLMEVIESIFGVIATLVADILYDKTMVNNLFTFDMNNYSIKIKNKPNLNNNNIFHEIKTSYLNNELKKENSKNQYEEKEINISKNTSRRTIANKKQKFNFKKYYFQDINNNNIYNIGNSEKSTSNSKNISSIKMLKKNFIYNSNKEISEDAKVYNFESPAEEKVIDQRKIINKINTNLLCIYFCFCFVRKRENFGNALLDEAMNIITEKLDIYNMFRNFYFIDELKKTSNYEYKDFEMSDECKSKLKKVSNKIIDNIYHL